MKTMRTIKMLGLAAALFAAPAWAVTIGNQGKILFTDLTAPASDPDGNPLDPAFVLGVIGVDVNTPVVWTGSYDEALVQGTTGIQYLARESFGGSALVDPTLTFDVTVGNLAFTQTNDVDSPLFPVFGFLDGVFFGVDFVGAFDVLPDGTLIRYDREAAFPGVFDFRISGNAGPEAEYNPGTTLTISQFSDDLSNPPLAGGTIVPEPGTMLLLGSGLIGLAGFGRRKK